MSKASMKKLFFHILQVIVLLVFDPLDSENIFTTKMTTLHCHDQKEGCQKLCGDQWS